MASSVGEAVLVQGVTSEPTLNGIYERNGTFPHVAGEERPQWMKPGTRCYLRYHVKEERNRWELYVSHHPQGTTYFFNTSDALEPLATGWQPTESSNSNDELSLIFGDTEDLQTIAAENERRLIDESRRARREFFATGVENWLGALGDHTFASVSIPLTRDTSASLAGLAGTFADGGALAAAIQTAMRERDWSQAFVKLSTRAPKDSPQILQKAEAVFTEQGGEQLPANDRCALFSSLVQRSFCICSGQEAVELLSSSERVREDCAWATEGDDYDELGLHVVLRQWDGPVPPSNEFRGIIWKGHMNAVSQYYHGLFFSELADAKAQIEMDLRTLHAEIQPRLEAAGFESYIVDLAWFGRGCVKVIEVNPFDGKELGTMAASTCLFRWDNEEDRHIIQRGPFELRIRSEPQTEYELKRKMNVEWRQILFPPKWKQKKESNDCMGKGSGKTPMSEVGKGKQGKLGKKGKGYSGSAEN